MKSGTRKTTKSGCITCKKRKIKCDETRPACNKCLSTGRQCDGYGIWGGGNQALARSDGRPAFLSPHGVVISRAPPSAWTVSRCGQIDRVCFEWFTLRTIKKLPGPFALHFWNDLLLQVCLFDDAVMHALLSLSYVHKTGVEKDAGKPNSEGGRLVLQHYNRAISALQLQKRLQSNGVTSVQITLIACLVFINLDHLRGYFQTAEAHFHNGVKILNGLIHGRNERGSGSSDFGSRPTDRFIYQAFARINLQSELFKLTYDHEPLILHPLLPDRAEQEFRTMDAAWPPLEKIFNEALSLKTDAKSTAPEFILPRQRAIQSALAHWTSRFETATNPSYPFADYQMLRRVLLMFHTLACILVQPSTSLFSTLISHGIFMWRFRQSNPLSRRQTHMFFNMTHSMSDFGWIAPLYYTALKCRVRLIRERAVRLIAYGSHREGLWDSRICGAVARRVVDLETGGSEVWEALTDGELFAEREGQEEEGMGVWIEEVKVVMPDEKADGEVTMYVRREGVVDWEQHQVLV